MKADRTELSFDEAIAALHTDIEASAPWRNRWESSQACFPRGGPDFLRPQYVRQTCRWLGFSQEMLDAMIEGLRAFESNEALAHLAWHCHRTAFQSGDAPEESCSLLGDWPTPPEVLGDIAPMFYAIVLLSGLSYVRAMHERRGISEEVTRETLSDLEICTH
ncbi:MAG: DUF5596 domain-containing protein, partial [Planctomycetes bacterium]|nr:DUF5596 domain-containing protein [Planctomycetota bacterium]